MFGLGHDTFALLSVPFITGGIGYVTNWTAVLMLFYPVEFRGARTQWLGRIAERLPYRVRQVPGVMVGGIGWQGIVPSRAARMGSIAVDVGIAKLGTTREFFEQLDPDRIAEQIVRSLRGETATIIDRVMSREHPRLWAELPDAVKELIRQRVDAQLPQIVAHLTEMIAEHIDQLVDVKLLVIRRFDGDLANRVFLDMGRRELTFIRNFGFAFGFLLGIPVAWLTHFVTYWWLLPLLGVLVGFVTNWVALWMIYEPPEWRQYGPVRWRGLFVRRQDEVADMYAKIVSEEILTVANFGQELLTGPQSDRMRALIEAAMAPAIDRAAGVARHAVRAALGSRDYESLRRSFAHEPVAAIIAPLTDPAFSRSQSTHLRKLVAERLRQMPAPEFADMLRAATSEDEWLLLAHGAILGLAGGLFHLLIFSV
jgi:uncharacterized membrane protein YheB (UPF0754 family)